MKDLIINLIFITISILLGLIFINPGGFNELNPAISAYFESMKSLIGYISILVILFITLLIYRKFSKYNFYAFSSDSFTKKYLKTTVVFIAILLLSIKTFILKEIDATSLGILTIISLPWLISFISHAELPGGIKVQFKDIQKIVESISTDKATPKSNIFKDLYITDPNIAAVHLRIELEKRLNTLLELSGLGTIRTKGIAHSLNILFSHEILNREKFGGLSELISIGNKAAHGAKLDDDILIWMQEYGPSIISSLDNRIKGYKSKNQ